METFYGPIILPKNKAPEYVFKYFHPLLQQKQLHGISTKTLIYTVVAIAWYENRILTDWREFSMVPS